MSVAIIKIQRWRRNKIPNEIKIIKSIFKLKMEMTVVDGEETKDKTKGKSKKELLMGKEQ